MMYNDACDEQQTPACVHARVVLGMQQCHSKAPASGALPQMPQSRCNWRRILLGTVLACLLLRYVVDVRVTFRWRTSLWHAKAVQGVRHCSNTCFKAQDGVCDEGRPGINNSSTAGQQLLPGGVSMVSCDLGTDCGDCGPWFGPQAHLGWSEQQLPVEFLRSNNISVRYRLVNPQSAAPLRGMSFAYVDPQLDVDVSRHVETHGMVEVGISQVFYSVLHERCGVLRGGSAGLVVDVGANFGWFSLLSAKLGCSVVAWEPVPQFRALLSFNLAANKLAHLVTVREGVVADNPQGTQVVHVPNRGIWGTAGIDGANIDTGIANEGDYLKVEVPVDSLDEVLAGQHVDLLKVDVEGFEPAVMTTATQLLSSGAIDNLVLEYTPGVLERAAKWREMWRPPQMLMNLTAAGFELFWLSDAFTRTDAESRSIADPLQTLQTITPQNLAYDLWDAHAYRTGVLDQEETPFCQALVELGLSNMGMPERLHPKSFHSVFSHNTNVWATRNMQLLQQQQQQLKGKPVGVVPRDLPTNTSWFPPRGVSTGLGAVDCTSLAAELKGRIEQQTIGKEELKTMMAVLIGRRCRCTHQLPCQQQEEAAERCTRAGQTPYHD